MSTDVGWWSKTIKIMSTCFLNDTLLDISYKPMDYTFSYLVSIMISIQNSKEKVLLVFVQPLDFTNWTFISGGKHKV